MKQTILILILATFTIPISLKSQLIQYNVTPATCITCCNGSFTLTFASCYNFIYNSNPSLELFSSNLTQRVFINVCPGPYLINIFSTKECGGTIKQNFTMPFATALPENNLAQFGLSVFPNPAKNAVNVRIKLPANTKNTVLNLNDISGSLIKQMEIDSENLVFNSSDLTEGMYFLSIVSAEKVIAVRKIFIVK